MFDLLASGISVVFAPRMFLLIVLAVFLGTLFGALPGVSATMAVTLGIPFTYTMDPVSAIAFLVAIYCASITGGGMTAILFKIPGVPSSAPTTYDGYPMAQRGEAGKALGLQLICSAIGGMFAAVCMLLLSPQLTQAALSFGPSELFAISFMGLSILTSLETDNICRTIISGLLGATLSIEFGFTGGMSFLMAIVIATPFALVLGGGYGWMLNKIKGGEMMVATYVGFSSVSFMCMMWLLLPYKSPTMVWGFAGKGLRTTISLEGFYDQFLAKFLQIDLNRFGINLVIPTGSLLFFALLAFLMWVFLHTKTGTAMTAVGSNPTFAKAAGISVDKTRLLSVVLSTWLGAVGILLYEQGFGFVQIYMAPLNMAFPAVAAILIGGASVNKASITNVIIGTILYQGLVTMTPTVMNAIVHLDISEVIRIIVSNGMIVYALTRKTEGGK